LSANGDRPATALIFGDEVGVQLVRVPPATESKDAARLILARLLKGDVHIVSLGLSSLLVEASAPKGAPKMSWGAHGRLITAFQHNKETGVRAGW
jgi:hypothetical protein